MLVPCGSLAASASQAQLHPTNTWRTCDWTLRDPQPPKRGWGWRLCCKPSRHCGWELRGEASEDLIFVFGLIFSPKLLGSQSTTHVPAEPAGESMRAYQGTVGVILVVANSRRAKGQAGKCVRKGYCCLRGSRRHEQQAVWMGRGSSA